MNETVFINDTSIVAKEYSEERVITAWDIAKLHKREIREINQNFKYIKDRLKFGEDYYVVTRDYAESNQMIQEFLPNNVKEIILFTETGYLMLVRTLNDDLSWEIQKSLIKTYFTLKKMKTLTVEDMIIMQANEVKAVKNKVEVLENRINNQIRIDHAEQLKVNKSVSRRVYLRAECCMIPVTRLFRALYRDLKNKFGVSSYKDIKRQDLNIALEYISAWIENADLRQEYGLSS